MCGVQTNIQKGKMYIKLGNMRKLFATVLKTVSLINSKSYAACFSNRSIFFPRNLLYFALK